MIEEENREIYEIEKILSEFKEEVKNISNKPELQSLKSKYIGKKGVITELFKRIHTLPPDRRPAVGRKINEAKDFITKTLNEIETKAEIQKDFEEMVSVSDITLPYYSFRGGLHPLTITMRKIEDIFTHMGFEIEDGPECETDWFNFEALNIPKDHPARDMQDTFYLENGFLLRTHTSPVQIRTMMKRKPPVKIIAPGKVFRRDWDATHSPVFHQVEGLLVDSDVKMSDLFGVLEIFLKGFFSEEIKVRFRPSYFPFTEPSAEVDISCICYATKKDCRLCKGTGFLEVAGCGMVHPNVFKSVNYTDVTGFAFGMGVERLCMLKFGVKDIRLFFEGDIRFLKNFRNVEI